MSEAYGTTCQVPPVGHPCMARQRRMCCPVPRIFCCAGAAAVMMLASGAHPKPLTRRRRADPSCLIGGEEETPKPTLLSPKTNAENT